MRRRPPPRAPAGASPLTRADFDRVFDRYIDSVWAVLAPRAARVALQERVERIMTRIAVRWSEGVRDLELDLLALELVRSEEKALEEAGSDEAPPDEAAS